MVSNLHTLLLYNAEINVTLKWLGWMKVTHAEMLQALALEQYGSRLDHMAIYQSLNMQLTYDPVQQ